MTKSPTALALSHHLRLPPASDPGHKRSAFPFEKKDLPDDTLLCSARHQPNHVKSHLLPDLSELDGLFIGFATLQYSADITHCRGVLRSSPSHSGSRTCPRLTGILAESRSAKGHSCSQVDFACPRDLHTSKMYPPLARRTFSPHTKRTIFPEDHKHRPIETTLRYEARVMALDV